jgi:predicted nucleic acid-binding protein
MASKRKREPKVVRFVLDCSMAMSWYFKDEGNTYSSAVRRSLARAEALVPGVWPLEVANVLVLAERRHRSNQADATKWLQYLRSLPIRTDNDLAERAWSEILGLARSHALTTYDAAYLELALRLGLPLASLDATLTAAAKDAGVPEYRP